MKRILAAALGVLFALGTFVACGGNTSSTELPSAVDSTPVATSEEESQIREDIDEEPEVGVADNDILADAESYIISVFREGQNDGGTLVHNEAHSFEIIERSTSLDYSTLDVTVAATVARIDASGRHLSDHDVHIDFTYNQYVEGYKRESESYSVQEMRLAQSFIDEILALDWWSQDTGLSKGTLTSSYEYQSISARVESLEASGNCTINATFLFKQPMKDVEERTEAIQLTLKEAKVYETSTLGANEVWGRPDCYWLALTDGRNDVTLLCFGWPDEEGAEWYLHVKEYYAVYYA